MIPILEAIFGNRTAANTLLFIENYGSGYARRIAGTYDTPVSVVQDQLRKLESAGVLISSTVAVRGSSNSTPGILLSATCVDSSKTNSKRYPIR